MLKQIIYKIFGTRNERLLKEYRKNVNKINQLEDKISGLTNEELQSKTTEFKNRSANGETIHQLLPEVFAVCREASKRIMGMRHFDVQLIGGMVLNDGKIAEMRTGEGKTLMSTLAAYLNAITGNGVHIVTVNDYLAKRDAEQMGKLYNFLGLTVGINLPDMPAADKQAAYACDITYGTNNEFGFDYLRDNMVFETEDKVQRRLSFAIVDEVDSILIDEARTPLIISGPAEGSNDLYLKLNQVPSQLVKQTAEDSAEGDFWIDEKNQNVVLSELGHVRVEQILAEMGLIKDGDSLYSVHNISLMHHLIAAMRAHYVYMRDGHYVVQNNEVIIVDEFTGRLMSGRRWSDGLHQAVEAKEGVEIQRENQTLASITFQNYFRMYKKLSGMTGTADTEAYEFQQIYGLETVVIPTNRPMIRHDANDKIYMSAEDKFNAIVEDIKECSAKGQPVLVGTTSVENSEIMSMFLTKADLKHEVLNAKQHAREADIIVQAGYPGNITVATNMAGRGTDIILGGNPKPSITAVETNNNLSDNEKVDTIKQITTDWQNRSQQVKEAGGLYIIGTERHESRRIDNQLRGRSGRQGDQGASRFYLSLDDSLLRIFGGERMLGMMKRLGMKKGEAIEHRLLSRSIESAQRKVEGHNFDIRKQLLDYDDVSNDQRKVIYNERDEVLNSNNLTEISYNMIKGVIGNLFDSYIPPKSIEDLWDIKGLEKILKDEYLLDFPISETISADRNIDEEQLRNQLIKLAQDSYTNKMNNFTQLILAEINQFVDTMVPENHANWNLANLDMFLLQNRISSPLAFATEYSDIQNTNRQEVLDKFKQIAQELAVKQITRFERGVLLQHMDHHWREHLTQLDQLRQGIGLRGYAQKDPKQEYKQESFALFSQMLDVFKSDVVKVLMTVNLRSINDIPQENANLNLPNDLDKNIPKQLEANLVDSNSAVSNVTRNSQCPCGSGKKYKHCHGRIN